MQIYKGRTRDPLTVLNVLLFLTVIPLVEPYETLMDTLLAASKEWDFVKCHLK